MNGKTRIRFIMLARKDDKSAYVLFTALVNDENEARELAKNYCKETWHFTPKIINSVKMPKAQGETFRHLLTMQ